MDYGASMNNEVVQKEKCIMYPKYDEDFYGWAMATALLLKQGKFNEVEMNKIIEEMESLGKSHKREFRSRSGVLIAHLLKCQYQLEMKDIKEKSWKGTITIQRIDLNDLLDENPSLKSYVQELMPKAYQYALAILSEETPLDLKNFPTECPYTFEQIMDEEFYPDVS